MAAADDHQLLRKALCKLVDASPDFRCVMEADDGEELLHKLRATAQDALPDVLLLDVQMPKIDGISAYVVYDGNRYFSPDVMAVVMEYLSASAEESWNKLSWKEMAAVRLIFQEKTSEEMAEALQISKRNGACGEPHCILSDLSISRAVEGYPQLMYSIRPERFLLDTYIQRSGSLAEEPYKA